MLDGRPLKNGAKSANANAILSYRKRDIASARMWETPIQHLRINMVSLIMHPPVVMLVAMPNDWI